MLKEANRGGRSVYTFSKVIEKIKSENNKIVTFYKDFGDMLMVPVISNFDKADKKQRKISVMEQFAKRVAVQTRKIQLPKSKKFSELKPKS